MNYEQSLAFIHGIPRFGPKLGLERIQCLLERLDNPQKKMKFIHVAGTNGKGSTCTMLSYILTEAGYRTGLYISPFIIDFTERIQVNNQMISQEDLARITSKIQPIWEELSQQGNSPSEFEVVLAIALEYYFEQGCDVVILEVGMGGRYDATNVIDTPLVCVMTKIGLDHTEYLGDTLTEIAGEKAGIIKRDGVCVSAPQQDPEVLAVFMQTCAQQNNVLHIPHQLEIVEQSWKGSRVVIGKTNIFIPLGGRHQIDNAMTVLEVCRVLQERGYGITEQNIISGIAHTQFPARLEAVQTNPLVLLDGAHNVCGAQALREAVKQLEQRPIYGVVAMMKDKNATDFLREISDVLQGVVVTSLGENPRAFQTCELGGLARQFWRSVQEEERPMDAVEQAKELAGKNGAVLVCGSLYLLSELRQDLLQQGDADGTKVR